MNIRARFATDDIPDIETDLEGAGELLADAMSRDCSCCGDPTPGYESFVCDYCLGDWEL